MPNETIKTLKIYKTLQDIVDKNNIMLTTDQVCDVAGHYLNIWEHKALKRIKEDIESEFLINFLHNLSLHYAL
jgi:hypothetical protein